MSNSKTPEALIVGCGYTGERLAQRLIATGSRVSAVLRSEGRSHRLRQLGVSVCAEDLDAAHPAVMAPLTSRTVVYYLAPPPAQGGADPRLEHWLARQKTAPARIVYTSTSGVYGHCDGALVSEAQPVNPKSARAKRRVAAEHALAQWAGEADVDWLVLRVAGIYGPGRLPLDSLARREPVIAEDEAGPGNRIHVDDLVTVLEYAGASGLRNLAVNVADGNDHSGTWFRQQVASLAGLPSPPVVSRAEARATFSPRRYSFLAESRQLDVTRLLQELKVPLRWTDQRAGIQASL